MALILPITGGYIVIGVSNNWRRLHGVPLYQKKRYPHESKKLSKNKRVKYHAMKKVGCDDSLIQKYLDRMED